MACLNPILRKVPKGDWFCSRCAPRSETDVVTWALGKPCTILVLCGVV
jgi:hypothetical protein